MGVALSSTRAAPRAASAWLSEQALAALDERPGPVRVIGRLVRTADFERVLRTPKRASTAHFAVHHLADWPSVPAKPKRVVANQDLSTGAAPAVCNAVDESPNVSRDVPFSTLEPGADGRLWLGTVVPKKHARRSVTRTLLKRQIRAAVLGQRRFLSGGLWVVRLRAPFDSTRFTSAASHELQCLARAELDSLLAGAMRPAGQS